MIAGSRVEVESFKRHASDFVLWKPSKSYEPKWASPWGEGRPGWHIECSVMSETILGLPFDIHGGGIDLKFPHHENEIAQSCCLKGININPQSYAKYWIHNGFVMFDDVKMSKSLNNTQYVNNLLNVFPGEVIRLALLSSHYRQPLNWSETVIQQSKNILDRVYRILREMEDINIHGSDPIIPSKDIMNSLLDDINTSKSFSLLNRTVQSYSKSINKEDKRKIKKEIYALGNLLGIFMENPSEWLGYYQSNQNDEINKLIKKREQARKNKNFLEADEIRAKLYDMEIEIEDTSDGTIWRSRSN